jgi:excinuclease UvrABC nuclease subunit
MGSPGGAATKEYRDAGSWNREHDQTALYQFYNSENALIYVGVTYQLKKRLYQHARDKSWWPEVARQEVDWYDRRSDALEAEARLIELHDPPYIGSRSRSDLKDMKKRIALAAARAGMSRARWIREVTESALAKSEAATER